MTSPLETFLHRLGESIGRGLLTIQTQSNIRRCRILKCGRKHAAKGYCAKHYVRQRRRKL